MRQFITCSAESYILIWDLKRPPADLLPKQVTVTQADDDEVFEDPEEEEEKKKEKEEPPKKFGWSSLKAQTSTIVTSNVFSKDKKWSPAIGKYEMLK